MRLILFIAATTTLAIAACSNTPSAEPPTPAPGPAAGEPFKFVSDPVMKDLMATKFEILSEKLWSASIEETAPKKDADWKPFEDAARQLIEVGNAMMAPPLAKDQGKWKEESEKLVRLAEASLKAVKEKNLTTLSDVANRMTEESCTSCHKLYYTGP